MYEPADRPTLSLAFLWPAIAAATASNMAAAVAKNFTDLAMGADGPEVPSPKWTTPNRIALELKSVRLRDFSTATKSPSGGSPPALVVAPFALHSAVIADLAADHSLVGALRDAGLAQLFLTDWRSSTADMRFLGIDDYLAELNVLIDQIAPPVDLVGLCQGGWMSMIYAARFPEKVRRLVLAAAPIDIAAAPSPLSTLADASPLAAFQELVGLGDGLVPGRKVLKFWIPGVLETENIVELLQTEAETDSDAFAGLEAAFRAWYAYTLDLPGVFFLETVERLYKRNELASGSFSALGRRIDLASVRVPLFLIAARNDELVAAQQLFAAEHLVGTAPGDICKITVPGRHLGLFMGRKALMNVWPSVVRWLKSPQVEAPQVEASQVDHDRGHPRLQHAIE